jgi:hypothetical protein
MRKPLMEFVACCLVVAVFVMLAVPRVYAGFAPSEVLVVSQVDRSADLGRIQKILELKMVQQRLEDFGFSQNEIQSRLDRLTDGQIHELASTLDQLQVGGDTEVIIIILLGVALVVVLYFWLTGQRLVLTK